MLTNLSYFTGIRSGKTKWIQIFLTLKCRWLDGQVCPSSELGSSGNAVIWVASCPQGLFQRSHLVMWFHVSVGQVDNGKVQSLFKSKALSYFSDNWCLPRNPEHCPRFESFEIFLSMLLLGHLGEIWRSVPWITEIVCSNQWGI